MSNIVNDITFIMHFRYDSDDRVRNLQTILNYYSGLYVGAKFIIVEDDASHCTKLDNVKWPKNTSFYFITNNSYYRKPWGLNTAAKFATTNVLIQIDTDAIVPKSSIDECYTALTTQKDCVIAFPYNGFFIDTSIQLHQKFIDANYNYNSLLEELPPLEKLELGYGDEHFGVRCTPTRHTSVGGIAMFNRELFYKIGGYNPNFIAWGAEDNEIINRILKLELKDFRDTKDYSICFHLFHRNAVRNNHPYYNHNFVEADKVDKMNKLELEQYISIWNPFTNEKDKVNL